MSGNNVIELNGKKYDTRTGQLLTGSKPASTRRAHAPVAAPSKTTHKQPVRATVAGGNAARPSRNIDGIKRTAKPVHSRATNHAKRPTQHSQTLMRRGTPQPQSTKAITVQEPSVPAVIAPAAQLYGIDEARLKRAQHVQQDKRVSRFAVVEPQTVSQPAMVAPAPLAPPAGAPAVMIPVQPVTQPSPLERAVANATSHTEKKVALKSLKAHHKIARKLHVKPRTLTTAAVLTMAVGLSGLVAYRQMPRIQTKIASSRAGVSASMPSYAPAGFNLARSIDYQPGEVTLTYASKADDGRSYTVTQTESFWTSESLRENYLDTLGVSYQTIQQNGKTIYLYGNNATWVDGGVWYRVQADQAQLSSQQLTDIISGL